jgi:uncharacterized membrane protein YqaE (UPF0057 family)
MNKITFFFLFLFAFCANTINALPVGEGNEIVLEKTGSHLTVKQNNWAELFKTEPSVKALSPEMAQLGLNEFLNLTPKKYKEMTGEKLGFKKTIQLKAAQKFVKKATSPDADSDIPKGLYIVLAIFGWAWIVMGMMDGWKGKDWWVNLILVLLCWLPGVIHAFIKMKKYYP